MTATRGCKMRLQIQFSPRRRPPSPSRSARTSAAPQLGSPATRSERQQLATVFLPPPPPQRRPYGSPIQLAARQTRELSCGTAATPTRCVRDNGRRAACGRACAKVRRRRQALFGRTERGTQWPAGRADGSPSGGPKVAPERERCGRQGAAGPRALIN